MIKKIEKDGQIIKYLRENEKIIKAIKKYLYMQ